jgi:hypothetical protein
VRFDALEIHHGSRDDSGFLWPDFSVAFATESGK